MKLLTNKIYNCDCMYLINKIPTKSINIVLTSPPYNTSRPSAKGDSGAYNRRYDTFKDSMSDEDYIDWTIRMFKGYERILVKNGTVLYNLSYSTDKPHLMWMLIGKIIENTDFTIAECIPWKKTAALPNNMSPNRLTRICEFVFVFCRKSETKTFYCNKKVTSKIQKTSQPIYENLFNFIEAQNNDGSTPLNKATFSSDLCRQLLRIYGKPGFIVLDSFLGTGTTAKACIETKMEFIGSEISKAQCEYADKIIKQTKRWQKF